MAKRGESPARERYKDFGVRYLEEVYPYSPKKALRGMPKEKRHPKVPQFMSLISLSSLRTRLRLWIATWFCCWLAPPTGWDGGPWAAARICANRWFWWLRLLDIFATQQGIDLRPVKRFVFQ